MSEGTATDRAQARCRQLRDLLDDTPGLACRANPDAWVPEHYVKQWVREPVALCLACPMQQACLELAELRGEAEGIYGGTTPADRRRRRRRGVPPGEPETREEVA
ncbi:MAG TPA: WhiB family transcriptional regulator [Nocardioidaceae bacterium]